ncbi:hypothetical protein [Saccharothrix lopnurensis]|uniref:SH3 domain-containing protein n=1 Tax=Saccharothrix lopnurensis TaxID=1670621 RepID=A0ABW1P8T5_9PSEU
MARPRRFVAGGIAALVVAGVVLGSAPAGAAPGGGVGSRQHACDSTRPPNLDDGLPFPVATTDLRAYSGWGTSCRTAVILRGQRLDYHCWVIGNDGVTWSYVSAVDQGVAGWVRDDLLPGGGSAVSCPS